MQTYTVSLTIENRRDKKIDFILEPWGEIYPMEMGVTFSSSFQSPTPGTIHIDNEDNSITVWAWSGCTASLKRDGEELGGKAFSRTPVP